MKKRGAYVNAVPQVNYRRNSFNLSHGVQTALNVGELVPLDVQEVLPGDTWNHRLAFVSKLGSSFVKPLMGNIYFDTFSFFVPIRLVDEDYENVFGSNSSSPWTAPNTDHIPMYSSAQTVTGNTLADYFGLPVGSIPAGAINPLPFRAFALIYNEFFMRESTERKVAVNIGSTVTGESLNNNVWSVSNYTGKPPVINRYSDYFSTAFSQPQKGPAVPIFTGAPVWGDSTTDHSGGKRLRASIWETGGALPLQGALGAGADGYLRSSGSSFSGSMGADIVNAVADGGTVNEVRLAFQLQKMLEKDSLFGTRYREYLLGHYGILNGDARMQVPEFLAGSHTPIQIGTVHNTGFSSYSDPITLGTDYYYPGQSSGFSETAQKDCNKFVKSFTEHGYVMTVGCFRYTHYYYGGIPKLWTRSYRNDFYDPLFANIGEQPIYNEQVYGVGSYTPKASVYGYNEAWAEYRTIPNRATNAFRQNFGQYFGLVDYNGSTQTIYNLTKENKTIFDNKVTVPSSSTPNFMIDLWFTCDVARVMPLYGTPGLVDHH